MLPSYLPNFIITHNVIENKESRLREEHEKTDYPFYFELYDDDDILYARGYGYDMQYSASAIFEPLDTWGAAYGCTKIKLRNKETNKMEFA